MRRLIAGYDANMLPPSDRPFATTIGDGVTPCTPDDYDCDYSDADRLRMPYPESGQLYDRLSKTSAMAAATRSSSK
jgi:hypothetical protein